MAIPKFPKIYHIIHVDRLSSVIQNGSLWCDAKVKHYAPTGSTIGIKGIKERRLNELTLSSHPGLKVGDCVPFYFCPRSVMLFVIYKKNHPNLEYKGGQEPIIHLEADLYETVAWANRKSYRWAFTLSNAGSKSFEDRRDLAQLDEIDWKAVSSTYWDTCEENKQAEFLVESSFPWMLVERIGVLSKRIEHKVRSIVRNTKHQPHVEIKRNWYY